MLNDLTHLLMILPVLPTKLVKDAVAWRGGTKDTPLLQPPRHHLQNSKGGFAEFGICPTLMAALLQVGLGKNLEPMGCMEIKKMGGLNAITHRKGKLLQDLPAHGVLAG